VQIKDAIFKTLIANGMFDNARIRLTLTRGKKLNTNRTEKQSIVIGVSYARKRTMNRYGAKQTSRRTGPYTSFQNPFLSQ
jgi:hypothetical protein